MKRYEMNEPRIDRPVHYGDAYQGDTVRTLGRGSRPSIELIGRLTNHVSLAVDQLGVL